MNPTTPMNGAELQTLREGCGLTRERLGELCSVSVRTVKHWETRAGASVPADVAGLVLPLAQLVHTGAQKNREDMLAIMRQAGAISVHLLGEKTPRAIGLKDTPGPVLIRYHEAADMPQAERLAGLLPEVHGAMVTRMMLDLLGEGFAPRVVWFDPEAYTEWLLKAKGSMAYDSNAYRTRWATMAIDAAAATPHPSDQPPPAHTPGR